MRRLLGAGLAAAILGLVAFVYGYPISDTSFGNAMMIDGVIVLCTGFLIMALSVVQRQLERLTDRLGAPLHMPVAADVAPGMTAATSASMSPAMGGSMGAPMTHAFDAPVAPPPEPSASEFAPAAPPLFPAAEVPAVEPEPAPAPPEPEPEVRPTTPERASRRNLLFESRRRDRAEPAPAPAPEAEAAAPRSFDDAWSGSSASHPREQAAAPPQPAAPTVIKSGVVDGMSYSLYSDGSIEAQMPDEGLMRFASLDALRDYLDQRS